MTETLEHKKARLASAALLCGIAAIVAVALVALPRAFGSGKGTLTVAGLHAKRLDSGWTFRFSRQTLSDTSNGAKVVSKREWSDPSVATAVNEAIRSVDSFMREVSATNAGDVASRQCGRRRGAGVPECRGCRDQSASFRRRTQTALITGAGGDPRCRVLARRGRCRRHRHRAGPAPCRYVVVGGSPATVTTKGAAPTVDKHVLENSSGAWRKQADATVGDSLFWRLEATVRGDCRLLGVWRGLPRHACPGIGQPSEVHVYLAAGDPNSRASPARRMPQERSTPDWAKNAGG